jgi:hypothetical protein
MMKGTIKNYRYHFKYFLITLLLIFLSGCGGFTPLPIPPPTPTSPIINSFSADVNVISEGGSTILSWEVSDADTVTIEPGVGTVPSSGSNSVSPTETTTYTLMASNDSGIVTADVTISILYPPWEIDIPIQILPPIIQSFSADQLIVNEGGSVTLSWEVSGLATVTIEPGIGTVDPIGSISVSPTETTTYTLTAGNISGDDSAQLTVILLQTKILQPGPSLGKDSEVSEGHANKNFGDYGGIHVGRGMGNRRAFIQFNAIENLPANTVILSANLELYLGSTTNLSNFYIELHVVTEIWEEDTITWNDQPDYLETMETETPINPFYVPCWVFWDISSLLQGWINGSIAHYGVALVAGNVQLNYTYIYSSDNIYPDRRPKLIITYYIP